MGGDKERRKHRRYRAPESFFATVRSAKETVGQVIDIGRGGVGFVYVEHPLPPKGKCMVDLFTSPREFFLPDLPSHVVSNSIIPPKPFTTVMTRRCGIAFRPLTQEQAEALAQFLKKLRS